MISKTKNELWDTQMKNQDCVVPGKPNEENMKIAINTWVQK